MTHIKEAKWEQCAAIGAPDRRVITRYPQMLVISENKKGTKRCAARQTRYLQNQFAESNIHLGSLLFIYLFIGPSP